MIVSNSLSQINDAQQMIKRLTPDLLWIQKHASEATRYIREIESMAMRFSSPFDTFVLQDRTWTYLQKHLDVHGQLLAGAEQHRNDHMLISVQLPKRGWYLSGQEPCTLSDRLANAVREENWEYVDQEMMKHLPQFNLERLIEWLAQEQVPQHCTNRLVRFLKNHDDGNYEEATYLGVPLLDEIAAHLYSGKSFTTKRGSHRRNDQSKPELAFKTTSGPDLASYCESFVQTFGSLQEDPDHKSLRNENYWNRHAIVHGLMQRAMGLKDSAKCLMAINFLLFAREEVE